ncbi:hypothetical protein G6F68_013371 [Rhizopus microsporus]|nr:hypothetical protein G6F68_013371 [Rhizopus microsporus]
MGGADLFQRCIAGQAAQLVQLTAVADTHGRRHQAGTHALANHREQLLHRVVEALDLGHRPGLAAVAVQHRLDVQRAAQRGTEQADAAVALVPRTRAHVVQVAGDHVAVHVAGQFLQPLADLLHAGVAVAQAHRLHRGHRLRGEQVLGVEHAQCERRVVARGLPHRLVVVEDGEAGLQRVVVDRAAGLGTGHGSG